MDGGDWWSTVHRVAKGRTRLSDFTFNFIHTYSHSHPHTIHKAGGKKYPGIA